MGLMAVLLRVAQVRNEAASNRWKVAAAAGLVVVALAVRAAFFKYQTGDYTSYFHTWYEFIRQHGGFRALRYDFANYNEPYLYLLALATYVPVPALVAIKAIPVAFDLLLGYFTYRVVRLRYPDGWLPMVAAAVTLLLPTVVVNSSWWGQVDATYASLCLGGVYFVLRRRGLLACTFFGLALAFKLQAIFIFPVLGLLVLRRSVRWRDLLMVPAAFVAMDVPAFLLGASLHTLWSTYTGQVGLYQELTLNAPNVYQYLGVTSSSALRLAGIAVTGVVVAALVIWVVWKRVELSPTRVILASAVSALVVPWLLPAMHERYFYLADVFTVVSAFYLPRRLFALPVLEQFASFLSYMPFLLSTTTAGGASGGRFGSGGSGRARPAGGGRPPSGAGSGKGGGVFPGRAGGVDAASTGVVHAPAGLGAGHAAGGVSAAGPSSQGLGVLSGHEVVSFKVLATVMLAAILLALWATWWEMRRRPSDLQVEEGRLLDACP